MSSNDAWKLLNGESGGWQGNDIAALCLLQVMLVAGVGPLLADLLHPDMVVPSSGHIPEDEVHLILEFNKGETWGKYTAPRANRFIVTHDRTNAEMRPLDIYPAALSEFGDATVLVFSGSPSTPRYRISTCARVCVCVCARACVCACVGSVCALLRADCASERVAKETLSVYLNRTCVHIATQSCDAIYHNSSARLL